jgi:hypothetical protein
VIAVCALLAFRAYGADRNEPMPEDADFLEYLGSVESNDENWTDFQASKTAPNQSSPKTQTQDAKAANADQAKKQPPTPSEQKAQQKTDK